MAGVGAANAVHLGAPSIIAASEHLPGGTIQRMLSLMHGAVSDATPMLVTNLDETRLFRAANAGHLSISEQARWQLETMGSIDPGAPLARSALAALDLWPRGWGYEEVVASRAVARLSLTGERSKSMLEVTRSAYLPEFGHLKYGGLSILWDPKLLPNLRVSPLSLSFGHAQQISSTVTRAQPMVKLPEVQLAGLLHETGWRYVGEQMLDTDAVLQARIGKQLIDFEAIVHSSGPDHWRAVVVEPHSKIPDIEQLREWSNASGIPVLDLRSRVDSARAEQVFGVATEDGRAQLASILGGPVPATVGG